MRKPSSFFGYVRTEAFARLALTPYDTADQILAAVTAQLDVATIEDLFALDASAADPLTGLKIAAGQLLLTDPTDPDHARRILAFSEANARVNDPARRAFASKPTRASVHDEQLTLVG